MASIMPLGRKYGAWAGFAFGFLSILVYDLMTNFGSWTWIAGIAYGLVGAASSLYFSGNSKHSVLNFAVFAFFSTIVFDLITGVFFAPLWGQAMWSAFILQIPFTALHLAGNIGFTVTLSPLLDKWLASSEFFTLQKSSNLQYNLGDNNSN